MNDSAALSNSGNEKMNHMNVMTIMSTTIATVGIVANLNVVVVLFRQKKLRQKIPNIFIINQIRLVKNLHVDYTLLEVQEI